MKAFFPMLLLLTLAHGLVDAFAATIQPLWPDLQRGLRLSDGSIQGAFLLWSLATSVSQLVFGYWGDRYRGRWLIWAGPAVAVVCMSAVGLCTSYLALCVVLIVGGLGVASFHPEAAALAGACGAERRSRAMSVFAVGGYLGQAMGPIYSGVLTTYFRPSALAWGMTWGLAAVALLAWALRRGPDHTSAVSAGPAVSLPDLVRGRGLPVSLILAIGVLRVLPAIGVPMALAYAFKARGASNEQIGVLQSVFLGAIGLGSLGCALFVHRAVERRVLWLFPVGVTPLLLVLPAAGYAASLACVGAAGLLLGATMPIMVSYGQRLMPEGPRVASSITMGVTWGLGGAAVALTMDFCNRLHRPELAFSVFAVAALASSVLCAWLPEPEAHARPRALADPA